MDAALMFVYVFVCLQLIREYLEYLLNPLLIYVRSINVAWYSSEISYQSLKIDTMCLSQWHVTFQRHFPR
jgi:hypothetical protein